MKHQPSDQNEDRTVSDNESDCDDDGCCPHDEKRKHHPVNASPVKSRYSGGKNGDQKDQSTGHYGGQQHLLILIRSVCQEDEERSQDACHVQSYEHADQEFGARHTCIVHFDEITLFRHIVAHVLQLDVVRGEGMIVNEIRSLLTLSSLREVSVSEALISRTDT